MYVCCKHVTRRRRQDPVLFFSQFTQTVSPLQCVSRILQTRLGSCARARSASPRAQAVKRTEPRPAPQPPLLQRQRRAKHAACQAPAVRLTAFVPIVHSVHRCIIIHPPPTGRWLHFTSLARRSPLTHVSLLLLCSTSTVCLQKTCEGSARRRPPRHRRRRQPLVCSAAAAHSPRPCCQPSPQQVGIQLHMFVCLYVGWFVVVVVVVLLLLLPPLHKLLGGTKLQVQTRALSLLCSASCARCCRGRDRCDRGCACFPGHSRAHGAARS